MIDNRNGGTDIMRKSISISIRVSEDELENSKRLQDWRHMLHIVSLLEERH